VKLIDPLADSHDLIRYASLVVSVTGTIAYEAALYGKPSMTVAPMYFGPILTANGINPYHSSFAEIFDCLNNTVSDGIGKNGRQAIIEFLSWIIAQSFKGIVSNPRTEPACMNSANLDNVARSMDIVINKRKPARHSSEIEMNLAGYRK
jgi:hypothetical protein